MAPPLDGRVRVEEGQPVGKVRALRPPLVCRTKEVRERDPRDQPRGLEGNASEMRLFQQHPWPRAPCWVLSPGRV